MADHHPFDRRRFFQRLRPAVPSFSAPGEAGPRADSERAPSAAPAIDRAVTVDWHPDAVPTWEGDALVVFTQAGAMFRWELTAEETAFVQSIDGRRSIGELHDAIAVDSPDTAGALAARIGLLSTLHDARVLRVVPDPAHRRHPSDSSASV